MKKRKSSFRKATDITVTQSFLDERFNWAKDRGYEKAKWIQFCETLLSDGFDLSLYEARRSWSKYITIKRGSKSFKVRFSNHRPIKSRELNNDCDFFVGVNHTVTTTTDDALSAVRQFFQTEENQKAAS